LKSFIVVFSWASASAAPPAESARASATARVRGAVETGTHMDHDFLFIGDGIDRPGVKTA